MASKNQLKGNNKRFSSEPIGFEKKNREKKKVRGQTKVRERIKVTTSVKLAECDKYITRKILLLS